MDVDAESAGADTVHPLPPPQTSLRRRNSIATSVTEPVKKAKLSVSLPPFTSPNGSASAGPTHHQHELHLKGALIKETPPPSSLSYTSLKDLLPHFSAAAINSPTASSSGSSRSGYEISIRNRLVKQAAWAYLQPMLASSGSSGPSFIQRLWLRLCSPLSACLGFVACQLIPSIARVLYRILRAILCCSTR